MRTWFTVFGLLVEFVSAQFATASTADRIAVSVLSAQSGGHRIQIDRYSRTGNLRGPSILVLHGAGGIIFDGPEMRRVARRLAEDGNAVYVVHYFNRTGTTFGLDSNMQKHFATWLTTVRACIQFVQRDRGDQRAVGIYGYSLGAFLALAAASDNPAVGAVVEHAGGIWNGESKRIGRMPPVLVLHGQRDKRVPFPKYSEPLVAALRQRRAHLKTRFFPSEGHVFSQQAMTEVREAAATFFRANLAKHNGG